MDELLLKLIPKNIYVRLPNFDTRLDGKIVERLLIRFRIGNTQDTVPLAALIPYSPKRPIPPDYWIADGRIVAASQCPDLYPILQDSYDRRIQWKYIRNWNDIARYNLSKHLYRGDRHPLIWSSKGV